MDHLLDESRRAELEHVPVVVVYATETAALIRALTKCRVGVRWVAEPTEVMALRRSVDCWIALVGVDHADSRPALAAVSALARNGFTIACCRSGASTLREQCALLLAGAVQVLDTADPAFASQVTEWLRHALAAESGAELERRRLEQDLQDLCVVGRSPGLLNVFRWVQKAAALSRLPVLITGETGTGKEVVARAIHRLDPLRRGRPFVPLNCGAINAGLVESDLFGHRRGAFTGAERDRKGLVRSAGGGVLFLDEIGDLDAAVQGKLLRVLQERRVLGLGEDQEVAVDVRIVAATNRGLEKMVAEGTFRADLFFRLNVLAVRVPPLRERVEDIEPLVRHFLAAYGQIAGRPVSVTTEFLVAMRRLPLAGNVRELDNLVLRAYISSRDEGQVRLNALPPEVWHQLISAPAVGERATGLQTLPHKVSGLEAPQATPPRAFDPCAVLEQHAWNLRRSIDFCERQIVTAALGVSSGNRNRAAKLLGISPRGLFNKIRKSTVA